jgi:hypothetical protein
MLFGKFVVKIQQRPNCVVSGWDPMIGSPERLFTLEPKTEGDSKDPWIRSIAVVRGDKFVMADYSNARVKTANVTSPDTITASITLKEIPRRLAVLSDSKVAVTTYSKVIYLLSVEDSDITVTSRMETRRKYMGISGSSVAHCGM